MNKTFNLSSKEIDDFLVLKLNSPRIDTINSSNFREKVLKFIKDGKQKILLDLSDVSFIDSAGMGALIGIYRGMPNKNDLLFCGVDRKLAHTFYYVGIMGLIHMFPNEAEALSSYKAKHPTTI